MPTDNLLQVLHEVVGGVSGDALPTREGGVDLVLPGPPLR